MTVLKASDSSVALNRGKSVLAKSAPQWVRPSDWLTLTIPSSAEQKFVGLIAVFNQSSNYVAIQATVSSGTYTVDWGDGSSPVTQTSGVKAEYNYAYSSLGAGTLSSRGYRQAIITVTPTTGGATFTAITTNVRHSARPTQVSSVYWLDIAISAHDCTSFEFVSTNTGTQNIYANMLERIYLDFNDSLTNMAWLFFNLQGLQSVSLANTFWVNNMDRMFNGCSSLRSVPQFNTSNVLTMTNLFAGCTSLQYVPYFDTSLATNMSSLFGNCPALTSVPKLSMASATNIAGMFNGCRNLTSVPLFDFPATVTSLTQMFQNCSSLTTVPLFNTANITSFSQTFSGCTKLVSVPLFNTAAAVFMSQMFASCVALTSVPLFNTANVTDFSSMLGSCASLKEVPQFNTGNATNMGSMFQGCSNLVSLPQLNTSKVTNLSSQLASTNALLKIDGLDGSSIPNSGAGLTLNNNPSVSKAVLTNFRFSCNIQNCNFGPAELDELYTSLATLNSAVTNATGSGSVITYTVSDILPFAVSRTVTITGVSPASYNISGTITAVSVLNKTFTVTNAATGEFVSGGSAAVTDNRTVTVTGNPGVATDTPSIATNKGWVVTG